MRFFLYALLCTSLQLIANPAVALTTETIGHEVIAERTHKPSLFTQGFLVDGDHFYESSGLYKQSFLASYPIAEPASTWAKISAPFTKKQSIPTQYFAEGLALLNNKLYLLTWQEQTLLVYDKVTFNYEKSIPYKGEGWGLTTDGTYLIRSDGSDTLYFHNADDFSVARSISVTHANETISNLNELEYAQGFIWANVWHQDYILKINPDTGKIEGKIDLSALKKSVKLEHDEQVLNGIAWDEQKQAFWVTGKWWPKMFLIRMENTKPQSKN